MERNAHLHPYPAITLCHLQRLLSTDSHSNALRFKIGIRYQRIYIPFKRIPWGVYKAMTIPTVWIRAWQSKGAKQQARNHYPSIVHLFIHSPLFTQPIRLELLHLLKLYFICWNKNDAKTKWHIDWLLRCAVRRNYFAWITIMKARDKHLRAHVMLLHIFAPGECKQQKPTQTSIKREKKAKQFRLCVCFKRMKLCEQFTSTSNANDKTLLLLLPYRPTLQTCADSTLRIRWLISQISFD